MKKIKFPKKRNAVAVGLSVLCLLTFGGVLALVSHQTAVAENSFKIGHVNIGVIEQKKSSKPLEDKDNVLEYGEIKKDKTVEKKVSIKNIDSDSYPTVDTYVRVQFVAALRDKNGNGVGTPIQVKYNTASSKWVEKDGYYYYTEAVKPDELSELLLESVTAISEVPAKTSLEIRVLADGIQAEPIDAAIEAWGIDPTKLVP
ncbi:hypothetical protein [Anaerosacchariphilus polymeriproducens]|uniref:Alternate signal-mediated exported protein, CPF_0494 family n=1 Tax=Anaerosacchariphilus polymeriproducens TaxID=1812858 RepID=A0A371AZZ4_9FIRM|nr:hypothetical protein [Anaerosacchariphilus polymeriproducens]RDU25164.1 hypothetical protein DWV06_00615 [Anaerosacchariphilus polymeriproducens]